MDENIIIGTIENDNQIFQLLDLQQRNLKKNISNVEMTEQGFTTVEHSFEKLALMNKILPQIIAIQNNIVVGYALSMPTSFKNEIPELAPMMALLDSLKYKNKKLSESKYYVMGQICVDKAVRGRGIFQKMYEKHKSVFKNKYDFIVTEVSISNTRSMHAHAKIGFETIHTYFDPANNETWAVVLWAY